MENNTLHQQKVAILSRLIKETSLTLEEALLLLKEEEIKPVAVQYPSYPQIFTHRTSDSTLYVNSSSNVGMGTTTSADTFKLNIAGSNTADINN